MSGLAGAGLAGILDSAVKTAMSHLASSYPDTATYPDYQVGPTLLQAHRG